MGFQYVSSVPDSGTLENDYKKKNEECRLQEEIK